MIDVGQRLAGEAADYLELETATSHLTDPSVLPLVRDRYVAGEREHFDRELTSAPENRYQVAIARLLSTHGAKEVKRHASVRAG